MTPVPALLSIPIYDYILIRFWVQSTHAKGHMLARKVTVTKSRVAFQRKVL